MSSPKATSPKPARKHKKKKRRSRSYQEPPNNLGEDCDRCLDAPAIVQIHTDEGIDESVCKVCGKELEAEAEAKKDGTITFRNVATEHFDNLFMIFETAKYEEYDQLCEDPEIVKYVMSLMLYEDKHLSFLTNFLVTDVQAAQDEKQLFMSKTIGMRMITAFIMLRTSDYLTATLSAVINKLCKNPEGLELDITKAPAGEDVEKNKERLQDTAQEFFSAIADSTKHCPPDVRHFLSSLRRVVETKFADYGLTCVSSFLFQKLFCPAIVSPDKHGLVKDPPSTAARRALVSISKILQNSARSATGAALHDVNLRAKPKNEKKLAEFLSKMSEAPDETTDETSFANHELKSVERISVMSELLQRANLHFGYKKKRGDKCDYFLDIQDLLESDQPLLGGRFQHF